MTDTPDFSRSHQRLSFEGNIFVELMSPDVVGNQPREIACCQTRDVSQNGLRLGINRELDIGTILQIGVELSGQKNTLYLTGEVKWCERDNSGKTLWQVGFELMNASDSDIDAWRAQLASMET